MFRLSFLAFALLGFAFGSSKQGRELREKAGSMLTDMVSGSKEKIEQAKEDLGKVKTIVLRAASTDGADKKETSNGMNGHAHQDGSGNGKADSKKVEQEVKISNENQQLEAMEDQPALDVEKAQELADKLGAKPAVPEDENLKPFHNHDDDARKSA